MHKIRKRFQYLLCFIFIIITSVLVEILRDIGSRYLIKQIQRHGRQRINKSLLFHFRKLSATTQGEEMALRGPTDVPNV